MANENMNEEQTYISNTTSIVGDITAKGQLTIAVLLSPKWNDEGTVKDVAVKPLKEW